MTVLRILFATGFVFAICRASGLLLFRAIGFRPRASEQLFLALTTGAAIVSTVVFGLAACHLKYTWILAAVGTAILTAWLLFGRNQAAMADDSPPLAGGWSLLFWGPYLIYAFIYVFAAMMPEISPDGATYHLGLVVRYYEHRGFYPIATEMYAGLSGGIEMLFLVAFALGRHSAAAMVHLLFLLTLPLGMLAFARRMNVPRAGVIGALLFYLAPVAGRDGTCAYIDVATAAVVFSAFYFLEIWRTEDGMSALIPAGLLAGFAYACKFTSGIFAVYGLFFVLFVCRTRRVHWPIALGRAALFSCLAGLTALPWVIKNLVQFRNPFFPLFNDWFPNPYQYPVVESQWRQMLSHMNGISLAQVPYQLTIGGRLDGIVGPAFLLAPIALLSLRTSTGRRLLAAFVPLFLPYFGNIGARFTISALPFLSLALAIGITSIPQVGNALAIIAILAHAALSWPASIDRWFPRNQWRIDLPSPAWALRIMPEKQFLEEHWRDYKPGLLLDAWVPPNEKVFSPGMGQMAYQHREVLGTFDSAAGRRAWQTLLTPVSPERASTWLREFSFAPLVTREIRLVSDSDSENDFSVSEINFLFHGKEMPRRSSWKLKASANPWEVQLAFDNSSVSWWTSGERTRTGSWIGADFGEETPLDAVLVQQIADQRWTRCHLEAIIHGEWRTLRSTEQGTEHAPRANLRLQAADELKHQGIRWILMPDSLFGANDLSANAPYWGITEVGETNGFRLWRID